jgi:ATP-binding cassette, subfamily B, bacterial
LKVKKSVLLPSIIRILGILVRTKPGWLCLMLLLNACQGLFPAVSLWLSKGIIDRTIQGVGGGRAAMAEIIGFLALLFAFNVFSGVSACVGGYVTTILQDAVSYKVNMAVMEKSAALDLQHYESPSFYDMLSRAQREASFKPLAILSNLLEFGRGLIMMASLIVVLWGFHWLAIAVLILLGLPNSMIQQKFARRGYNLAYSQTQESRRTFYFNYLLTSIGFFKEIRIFHLKDYLLEQYKHSYLALFTQNKRLLLKKYAALLLISIVSSANYVLVYAAIIWRTVNGAISIGEMTLYAGAFIQCQGQMSAMIGNIAILIENNLFIQNLFAFLDLKSVIRRIDTPIAEEKRGKSIPGIEFENVTFRYPGGRDCILRDFNLTIRPDESVAVMGENGSGKTTIVKLLCRFYDPDIGKVTLDGIDIRRIEPGEYQSLIGAVFQDYAQYNLTARMNVGFGDLGSAGNIHRIRRAAEDSGADHVVSRMPMGYESVLGRYFNDGNQLSSGEWQRIALARAMMRVGRIIIWDEPTSSVDARAEYELFRRFKDIAKNKISLIISHKYSLVRHADRIIVLSKGRIVEDGHPDELLKNNGWYASFYRMQVGG